MAKNSESAFRNGAKVVASTDLRGVPAGTSGIVRMVAGVSWTRYRVDFANGQSVGSIDGSKLAADTSRR